MDHGHVRSVQIFFFSPLLTSSTTANFSTTQRLLYPFSFGRVTEDYVVQLLRVS